HSVIGAGPAARNILRLVERQLAQSLLDGLQRNVHCQEAANVILAQQQHSHVPPLCIAAIGFRLTAYGSKPIADGRLPTAGCRILSGASARAAPALRSTLHGCWHRRAERTPRRRR